MAALQGEAVDRVPVSLWGHVYDREGTAGALADSMVAFNERHDWDFVKVQARASYHAEVWGGVFAPSSDGVASPRCIRPVLHSATDWGQIDVKGPDEGVLGEQLEALRMIGARLGRRVPYIQTVFAPLTVAYYLCGQDEARLREIIRQDRDAARQGLANIAQTFTAYMRRCLEAGAWGFFFSLTVGLSRDFMREAEYAELAKPFDLEILSEISPRASFMLLHVCRGNIMFDLVTDYPVHAFNWSTVEPGNPSVREVLARTDKAVVGGLPEKRAMVECAPQGLDAAIRDLVAATGGRRLLLGGGCSQDLKLVPEGHVQAIRDAVARHRPR